MWRLIKKSYKSSKVQGLTVTHLRAQKFGKHETKSLSCGSSFSICKKVKKNDTLLINGALHCWIWNKNHCKITLKNSVLLDLQCFFKSLFSAFRTPFMVTVFTATVAQWTAPGNPGGGSPNGDAGFSLQYTQLGCGNRFSLS